MRSGKQGCLGSRVVIRACELPFRAILAVLKLRSDDVT